MGCPGRHQTISRGCTDVVAPVFPPTHRPTSVSVLCYLVAIWQILSPAGRKSYRTSRIGGGEVWETDLKVVELLSTVDLSYPRIFVLFGLVSPSDISYVSFFFNSRRAQPERAQRRGGPTGLHPARRLLVIRTDHTTHCSIFLGLNAPPEASTSLSD